MSKKHEISSYLRHKKHLGHTTTTNNHCRAVLGGTNTGIQQRSGTLLEGLHLEHTGRAVPEDRLGLGDGLGECLLGFLTGVETHPLVGDAVLVGGVAGLQVVV